MAIITVLAVGWVSLVLLAPFLPVPTAGVLYLFGSRICHQIAERSFHLDGAQLPVCARCLGIYAGAAAGALVALRMPRPQRLDPAARYMIAAAVLNSAMVVVEWAGVWQPSNVPRATAGALLGMAVAIIAGRALWTRHVRSVK